MPYGSGLSAQLMAAQETTVGTAVTVTRAYEILSESIQWTPTWLRGAGLKAGQAYTRASRVAQSRYTVAGDITLEHSDRAGMGLLWKHALGSTTTVPTLIATTAYKQIHTPSTTGKTGLGLTVQVGRPQTDGTVRAFTYNGVKISGWEFTCNDNSIAQLKLTTDGWNEATATALATASYIATAGVFSFEDATNFKLGGTASTASGEVSISGGVTVTTVVKGVTITGSTPLATDRYGLGNTGVKREQIDNGFPTCTIKLDGEFTSRTEIYDLMKANTTTALQLDFAQGDAGSANPFLLSFIFPACKITEGSVNADGPDILSQSISLEAFDDGTNAPVQVKLVSTDATLAP